MHPADWLLDWVSTAGCEPNGRSAGATADGRWIWCLVREFRPTLCFIRWWLHHLSSATWAHDPRTPKLGLV